MSVGVAIITYNRASYALKTVKAVRKHLLDVVDHIIVVNDGSDSKYNGEYRRLEKTVQDMGGMYVACETNGGVAVAKNVGLRYLLDEKKCDWMFTLEDDIIVQSPKAVTEYIRIATERGDSHYSFAHHGPANVGGPVDADGEIEFYPHSIGAWCMFNRECLETHGLMDEHFVRAWEHVEHELRLGVKPHRFPDIAGSAEYLTEIPGSIEKSSIRPMADWSSNIRNGLIYWRDTYPDTFTSLFGPGCQLEEFAHSVLA